MTRTNNSRPRAERGFVLRTPLLPLETFIEWQAAPDPRQFMIDLLEKPEIREALFVASPTLSEGIERWRREPSSAAAQQVELSLARYVARMAGRSTPFGLFSALSAGELGRASQLRVASRRDYRRRTRIDNDYLLALIDAVARQPEARAHLSYRPNDSLYWSSGRLRVVEARMTDKERSYQLVSVEPTPYLLATLERCRRGARLSDLVAGLVADDADVTREDAELYIDELCDAQLIVPELGLVVTGAEPIDAVIDQLAAAGIEQPARVLRAARDAISAIDDHGLGNSSEAYVAVARMLDELPAKPELSRLFQVDMVKPATAVLDTKTVAEVARVVAWLQQITRVQPRASMDAFRSAFKERYEGRTVPLTEVLDEEAGIGFEPANTPSAEGSPLLAGVRFPVHAAPSEVTWTSFEHHMQRRLAEALGAGHHELVLEDSDVQAMKVARPAQLPDAYHVQIRIARDANGADTVLLENTFGPSGACMLGRFCHASAEIDTMVRAHLRAEEAHRPDAAFAEIVHLAEGRIGNILCRPVLRDHEIVFLGRSGAPADRQISVDDLMVSVRGDRITLTSRRLGREVIPRLTTAHNFRRRSLGVYRFLCALQSEGVGLPAWTWGTLGQMPFLPRIRIGTTVVSRATWNVTGKELEPITKLVREMGTKQAQHFPVDQRRARIAEAVAGLRARLVLPRFVVITAGDHELPIDFENPMLVQVFADEISGQPGVRIVEQFPVPGSSPVESDEGTFANQVLLMFAKPRTAPVPATRPVAAPNTLRSFPPGSSWLYAKIYTGTSTADRVLREAVAPVVRAALAEGAAKHWFFIRYHDPHAHLRVRLAGNPDTLARAVLPALDRALAPLRADGSIWKVQLDTYEREIERYGGDHGIELAERLFWADSEAAISIIELLAGDSGADARWRLALRGSESLLGALGFGDEARHEIFAVARDSLARELGANADFFAPIGERYRRERAALEKLFAGDLANAADPALVAGFEILERRDERIRELAAELRKRDAMGKLLTPLQDLASTYVHMHVNRVLRAWQREQELVLYDLLRRLHEARKALRAVDKGYL